MQGRWRRSFLSSVFLEPANQDAIPSRHAILTAVSGLHVRNPALHQQTAMHADTNTDAHSSTCTHVPAHIHTPSPHPISAHLTPLLGSALCDSPRLHTHGACSSDGIMSSWDWGLGCLITHRSCCMCCACSPPTNLPPLALHVCVCCLADVRVVV